MDYKHIIYLSLLIYLPGIAALWRIKKVEQSFYPFIFYIWLGCINEATSFILIENGYSTNVNNNIYVLFAAILLLLFMRAQKVINQTVMMILAASCIVTWLIESILVDLEYISSYYRIFYSFILTLLSIKGINGLIVENRELKKEPLFLLYGCFTIFFLYKMIVESFWFYGVMASEDFRKMTFLVMIIINAVINIIYTIAILWIPRKKPSILLS